jgi:hypothetical protein
LNAEVGELEIEHRCLGRFGVSGGTSEQQRSESGG